MKASRARLLEAAGAVTLVLGAFAASCTYDFDQFVREPTAGASSAGHASSNGGAKGHGGATGGSGHAAAGTGETLENGGAAGEGGASGGTTNGASGGKAASGGATSNSAGQGGSTGGTAGQGGSAGKANSAGEGGARSSGGAGGKTNTSCSGTSYGGHCYFLIGTDTALDFPTAKTTCEAHSSKSHLVTITSAEEQAALVQAFFPSQADTWIGLSLADPSKSPDSICKLLPDQCPFKWVTGETLAYTDWAKRSGSDSEPNYTGSCVRLQAADETWADTGCTTSKNRAICEED